MHCISLQKVLAKNTIQTYSLYLICSNLTYKLKYIEKSVESYGDLSRLNVADNIDPHNSVCGWCIFELPRESYNQININTFQLEIKDIHNSIIQKESILLREELAGYEE